MGDIVSIFQKTNQYQYNQTIPDIMSYELVNQSTEICRTFSRQFWAKALELAGLYGWQPKGTRPPAQLDLYELNTEWLGTYLTNDGQIVKTEDAFLMAAALEKSLEHISDFNKIDWNAIFRLDDDLPEWLSLEEQAFMEEELHDSLLDIMGTHPLEFFAGDEKQHLEEFIRFCRLGSFKIL
jgi:hypothetical protein